MTAGGRGEAGALWAGPSLARLRWESHSCKLSTCRCRPPLASTRGDQASMGSAPFSKERTVCPPTKTTSPCGWALDSELAAKFLPTLGWPALIPRLCSCSLADGPWFQAGLRAVLGKMTWATATGHNQMNRRWCDPAKLNTLAALAALIPHHPLPNLSAAQERGGHQAGRGLRPSALEPTKPEST